VTLLHCWPNDDGRASKWTFYKALAKEARAGAVFLFSDVMSHSRQCFGEIYQAMREELQGGGGGGDDDDDAGRKGGGGEGGEGGKQEGVVGGGGDGGGRATKNVKKEKKGGGKGGARGGSSAAAAPKQGRGEGDGGSDDVLERWTVPYDAASDLKSEIMILRKVWAKNLLGVRVVGTWMPLWDDDDDDDDDDDALCVYFLFVITTMWNILVKLQIALQRHDFLDTASVRLCALCRCCAPLKSTRDC
jgi:hypothetical protein